MYWIKKVSKTDYVTNIYGGVVNFTLDSFIGPYKTYEEVKEALTRFDHQGPTVQVVTWDNNPVPIGWETPI